MVKRPGHPRNSRAKSRPMEVTMHCTHGTVTLQKAGALLTVLCSYFTHDMPLTLGHSCNFLMLLRKVDHSA